MIPPITPRPQAPKPKVKFKTVTPEGLLSNADREMTKFSVCVFSNKTDKYPKPYMQTPEWTWEKFIEGFRRPSIRANKDGPLFSPARFTKPHRLNENVHSLSMLVLDFDHNATLTETLEVCEGLGVDYLIYTTHSHQRVTKSHPQPEDCFRVVIPLKEPIPVGDFSNLFKWAGVIFDHKVDESRKDLAGMFYLPAIATKDSPYEFYSKVDGDFLDWRDPIREMKERENVGLTQGDAPLRSAFPPPPPTDAVEECASTSSPTPPTESNRKRTQQHHTSSSVGAAGVSLPLNLSDITYDTSDDFETYKAELIVHISKHHLAKLNRSGRLDAPGLCHGSATGTAIFCDPRINATTCNKGCGITQIAESYNYPPPKSGRNGKEIGEDQKVKDDNKPKDEPVKAK